MTDVSRRYYVELEAEAVALRCALVGLVAAIEADTRWEKTLRLALEVRAAKKVLEAER